MTAVEPPRKGLPEAMELQGLLEEEAERLAGIPEKERSENHREIVI